jgi:putative ABC transport system permease protein
VRSLLTIASMTISLTLMMILVSFFAINGEALAAGRPYNRIFVLNSMGFGGALPVVRVREVSAMSGVVAVSAMSWFGGKYGDERVPFAQFGVDADQFFRIYDDLKVPPDQLRAFQEDKAGCVIGHKLAEERGIKLGDPLPIKGDIFPVDLKLNVRGIYQAPNYQDPRMNVFHWEYMDEMLKTSRASLAGNAGAIVAKLRDAEMIPAVCHRIDEQYLNSDTPTMSQSEEAFGKMFLEMFGDLQTMMRNIGVAVVFSLICVSGNAMAIALRERTTEVAVLKAIGYSSQLVLFLVLAESMIVSGIGGLLGTLGPKALFDSFDISPYTGGFLPFFYVPATTAAMGLVFALVIGFISGIIPALRAANLSVVDGLRKVV